MKIAVQGLKLEGSNWTFSYRYGGKARRMKLGTAPALVPADARKGAQHFAGLVAIGRCPSSERKAARRAAVVASAPIKDQVEKVAAQYLKHHRARVRASTYRETARVFSVEILPAWRGRRLSEITKADVRKLIEGVARRARVGGEQGAHIDRHMDELVRRAGHSHRVAMRGNQATKRREGPRAMFGRRRACGRLAGLRGAWRIRSRSQTACAHRPAAKRSFQHDLAGNRHVREDLDAPGLTREKWAPAFGSAIGRGDGNPQQPSGGAPTRSGFPARQLFEGKGAARRAVAGKYAKVNPRPTPDFCERLRTSWRENRDVERALNHSSGSFRGIVGVYQRYDFADEKRKALTLWAHHIAGMVAAPEGLAFAA
jgi:Phage integrase, N-terminal SAM-like domain